MLVDASLSEFIVKISYLYFVSFIGVCIGLYFCVTRREQENSIYPSIYMSRKNIFWIFCLFCVNVLDFGVTYCLFSMMDVLEYTVDCCSCFVDSTYANWGCKKKVDFCPSCSSVCGKQEFNVMFFSPWFMAADGCLFISPTNFFRS